MCVCDFFCLDINNLGNDVVFVVRSLSWVCDVGKLCFYLSKEMWCMFEIWLLINMLNIFFRNENK